MTTRTDVNTDYYVSPRVIEVQAPSTEMVMQDLVDTVRKIEDGFTGMSFDKLLNASGKESLGGGTEVGITVALQNAVLSFEARTTPAEDGTVTGAPASTVATRQVMQDSAATFITNGIMPGSLLINFDDQSIADVVKVNSETEIETKILKEGISNTYTVTDVYKIWNVIQCNAAGGNLTAVDEFQVNISQIRPTAFTQVVLASSSSATTQNQESLNFATYQNQVTIDQANITGLAQNGTAFPAGTPQQPVLTLADAKTIAATNGFMNLQFRGNFTFAGSDNIDGFTCIGAGPSSTILDLGGSTSTVRTQFRRCNLTGDVNGAVDVVDCHLSALTGIGSTAYETHFQNCMLEPGSPITLSNAVGLQRVNLIDCSSASPGDTPVDIYYNGSDAGMVVRRYAGGLHFHDVTNAATEISFDGDAHLTLDSSCTAGAIAVRGDVKITDNSTGTFTVVDQGTYTKLLELWSRLGLDPNNPMTTNDDNSVSVGGITLTAVNNATDTTQTRSGTL